MIRGVYRFYQNGELLAESENLLTTEGKRLLLRVLAEQAASLGQAIGVGVGATAANVADTRLNWEVDRAQVSIKAVDYDNNLVIMKATLPQNTEYTIYEIGLWSQFSNSLNSDSASRILTTFETDFENWTNFTLDTAQARTSTNAMRIDALASTTKTSTSDVNLDLSGYSNVDQFSVAFYKANNNITTLGIVFESTSGVWRKTTTVSSLPVGYNVITMNKGDFVATGTPDWSDINKIDIEVTAGGTAGYLIMDGIRIEDADTLNPDYALVSHSVLGTPLVKTDNAPMDVEYAVEITFS
jgi:hypothetical protein